MLASLILAVLLSAAPPADALPARPAASAPQALLATPFFRTLGVADGLPSNRVYKVVQDQTGYLWFGTHDGLARYDGASFRVWRHDASDPNSISADDVSALYVDRDNRIWCGGEDSGLNVLDAQRERFAHFLHDANNPASLSGSDVFSIAGDTSGAVWVATYAGGVDRLDRSMQGLAAPQFVHIRHADDDAKSIASNNVLSLTFDPAGRLWIGSDAGLDRLDLDGKIQHVDFSAVPGSGAINATTLLGNDDGTAILGTRRGLLTIDGDLKAHARFDSSISDHIVYGIARSADGDLWVAGRGGLYRLDSAGHIWPFQENQAVPGSLAGNTVFDAMRDREGGLWFATLDGGVAMLPARWRDFSLFRNVPGNDSSLSANRVQGMAVDADGQLWSVNSSGGIDRLDPANGVVEHVGDHLGTPDKALWSVLPDHIGQLWVGHTRGLRVYNLQSGKFSDLAVDRTRNDALVPGLLNLLIIGTSGEIWASAYASEGGLHRIDPLSHRIERFDTANANLRNGEVHQIGFAPDGVLLVAHQAGLDRFDAATRRFSALTGAPAQAVLEFSFAADGSLWLHVVGALEHYRYDARGMQLIERVGAVQGWPTLTVGGMQIDDRGTLWVSSARGLWRYDPVTQAVRLFTSHDGLASSEFNRLPLLRRADGSIFGGTLAGIVGFAPARMSESIRAPPLLLAALSVRRNGRDIALDTTAGTIRLDWNDRDLRLSARALSYANPSALRYQWRLGGEDQDWVDSANRGEREYSQLRPGRHALHLRAASAESVWNEIAPLVIEQPAPPWATRWAYAGYALLAMLIGAWMIRQYRQRLERRHALELAEQQRTFAETTSAAKTSFLATMGHEIRTPMTGVLGMTELLLRTPLDAKQRGFAEAIAQSGNMMLRLVNDSLDLARIEAGKLELQDAVLDLHALVGEIATLAQTLVQQKGLAFALHIAPDAPRYVRGDAVRIKQIFLNLVNNAIKFTERGSIAVELNRSPRGMSEVSIRDSGPGIAQSTRARLFQRFEQVQGTQARYGGSGLGLAICRELVARMNGDIRLDSTVGVGSVFIVTLPLPEVNAAAAMPQATQVEPHDIVVDKVAALRVLLVEDDATVAQVVAGLLVDQGHAVRHVGNGLAALGEVETVTFDVALLDLDLPGIDGLALARMLRARELREQLPRLRIIGISARSVGDEEALCLAAGMDAFLRKPVTGALLSACLHRTTS